MMEKYSSDYSYYGNVYRKSADGNDILVEENAMLEYYDETFKFAFLSDAMAYILSLAYDKEEDNKVAENVLNSFLVIEILLIMEKFMLLLNQLGLI